MVKIKRIEIIFILKIIITTDNTNNKTKKINLIQEEITDKDIAAHMLFI